MFSVGGVNQKAGERHRERVASIGAEEPSLREGGRITVPLSDRGLRLLSGCCFRLGVVRCESGRLHRSRHLHSSELSRLTHVYIHHIHFTHSTSPTHPEHPISLFRPSLYLSWRRLSTLHHPQLQFLPLLQRTHSCIQGETHSLSHDQSVLATICSPTMCTHPRTHAR